MGKWDQGNCKSGEPSEGWDGIDDGKLGHSCESVKLFLKCVVWQPRQTTGSREPGRSPAAPL